MHHPTPARCLMPFDRVSSQGLVRATVSIPPWWWAPLVGALACTRMNIPLTFLSRAASRAPRRRDLALNNL